MGVLVGGESKLGSTEDEGIGGDPVEMRDQKLQLHSGAVAIREPSGNLR
jgi:hypothetical protein